MLMYMYIIHNSHILSKGTCTIQHVNVLMYVNTMYMYFKQLNNSKNLGGANIYNYWSSRGNSVSTGAPERTAFLLASFPGRFVGGGSHKSAWERGYVSTGAPERTALLLELRREQRFYWSSGENSVSIRSPHLSPTSVTR